MSRMCEKCGRGAFQAVSRSHSNIATKRKQFLNLQWKRVNDKRTRLCTRCIKTAAKTTVA
ncbi:MAG: L28 family ribosomal protein [bacterium]|nr:L28 family ribosomal protein [bacterium]